MKIPHPARLIITAVTAILIFAASESIAQEVEKGRDEKQIRPLSVGNYWTVRKREYDRDGTLNREDFTSIIVAEKELLGGRECYQMRQRFHETMRINVKELVEENKGDWIYWEFLENGNLYTFNESTPKEESQPEKENQKGFNSVQYDENNPALYVMYPAKAGDIFACFDSVGTVVATEKNIKTPAGEFLCNVYAFITDPSEPLPRRSYTFEYWCPGIGLIKIEEFEVSGTRKTLVYEEELLSYHLERNKRSQEEDDPDAERRNKIENVR